MTIELIIECLETQRQFVDDTTREAINRAIRSLEAWQKVLDDLEDCEDAGHWIDISQVFEIINRHLKEVKG